MLRVVIFGAGKSSPYLIKQLQKTSTELPLHITLVDNNWLQLPEDCKKHIHTTYLVEDISNIKKLNTIINNQDLVISMLPAHLHVDIVKCCLSQSKNLLTASYVSEAMQELNFKAKENGLLFLNEMGVDPGLDHMSAMELINRLKTKGATINSFYSHTGGLVYKTTPNSWNYKFTWNPRNVIIAGAEGATYIKANKEVKTSYPSIFTEVTPITLNQKIFDSYPNRNSLAYAEKYNLKNIKNLYRGTLRHQGYCEAWNIFVQLKMTDDLKEITFFPTATRKDFIAYFLNDVKTTEITFCNKLDVNKNNPVFKKFELLNFFNNSKKLTLTKGTAANILLTILSEDWKMQPNDNDILAMQHQIDYNIEGTNYSTKSELLIIGEDQQYTAMAKTVGAPMFEAALLMLSNKINLKGVHIPTKTAIFQPILKSLKNHGIKFIEKTKKTIV